MNVFVLCTGRCGSVTFSKACEHIKNFTTGHETMAGKYPTLRLMYPANHIEVDNRLSWFLGRLDETYGDNAVYVHLMRNPNAVAQSLLKRWNMGVVMSYRTGILARAGGKEDVAITLDFCDIVNSNIRLFLKDKTKKMEFRIETAKSDFQKFWWLIGAQGDLEVALNEFDVRYNR